MGGNSNDFKSNISDNPKRSHYILQKGHKQPGYEDYDAVAKHFKLNKTPLNSISNCLDDYNEQNKLRYKTIPSHNGKTESSFIDVTRRKLN